MSGVSTKMLQAAAGAGAADFFWFSGLTGLFQPQAADVDVDADGNVYVVGFSTQSGGSPQQGFLVKYDPEGVIIFARTLRPPNTDSQVRFECMVRDSVGNIYVGGVDSFSTQSVSQNLIAKYDSDGNILFRRRFIQTANPGGLKRLAVDSSNNVIGITTTFRVIKLNPSGNVIFARQLEGPSADVGDGVTVDASDNIYVAGNTFSQGAGQADFVTAKYNSAGALQWQQRIGGAGLDFEGNVAVDSSGNVYRSGTTQDGAGGFDILLVKYNSSGVLQWSFVLGTVGTERGFDAKITSAGQLVVVGQGGAQGVPQGLTNMLVTLFDISGALPVLVFSNSIVRLPSGASFAKSVAIDAADNIIFVGQTNAGSGIIEATTVKVPSDGAGTGSYTGFVYTAFSGTFASASLTAAASTLTPLSPSPATGDSSGTTIASASSFSNNLVDITP